MKKRHIILTVLAIVFVLSSSIGTAMAYFTTFVTAKGGYVLALGNHTEITEHYGKGLKTLSITNTGAAGGYPVFVRVRAFAGDDYTLKPVADGTDAASAKWNINPSFSGISNEYWYYKEAIFGTEKTNDLKIEIVHSESAKTKEWHEGDERNIIVVYESTPAIYKSTGEPDFETAWSSNNKVVVQEGGNG